MLFSFLLSFPSPLPSPHTFTNLPLGKQHYSVYWLYFPAFAVVIIGLIIYFWVATPEEQGKLDPQAPDFVRVRREGGVVGQV